MVESKLKKTDIGLIPEEWSIANWNDVFDFKSTASYSRAEINIQGNVGYIHYGDIYTKIKATLDVNKFVSGYVSKKQVKTYSFINEGDLIIADASEDQSGIGKSFEVINQPHNPVISGLHTFLIREKKNCVLAKGFKAYFYFNPLIKKQYDALATGLKVYSLSKGSFNHIQIPLPPLKEQQAIAKILSEADAWIDSLENIIAKKRQIKQGAMQMLLTPIENWKLTILGEVVEIFDNLRIPITESKREKGTTPYYGANGIQDYVKGFTHNGEFVLVAEDGANDLTNYPINFTKGKIWVNNHTHVLAGKSIILGTHFLSYLLQSIDFQSVLVGGTRAKLNKSVLEKIIISFPSLQEQSRIVSILSDLDIELENLEKKLAKAKQLKQGMMQQLLTGKIRLINSLQTS